MSSSEGKSRSYGLSSRWITDFCTAARCKNKTQSSARLTLESYNQINFIGVQNVSTPDGSALTYNPETGKVIPAFSVENKSLALELEDPRDWHRAYSSEYGAGGAFASNLGQLRKHAFEAFNTTEHYVFMQVGWALLLSPASQERV